MFAACVKIKKNGIKKEPNVQIVFCSDVMARYLYFHQPYCHTQKKRCELQDEPCILIGLSSFSHFCAFLFSGCHLNDHWWSLWLYKPFLVACYCLTLFVLFLYSKTYTRTRWMHENHNKPQHTLSDNVMVTWK